MLYYISFLCQKEVILKKIKRKHHLSLNWKISFREWNCKRLIICLGPPDSAYIIYPWFWSFGAVWVCLFVVSIFSHKVAENENVKSTRCVWALCLRNQRPIYPGHMFTSKVFDMTFGCNICTGNIVLSTQADTVLKRKSSVSTKH